MINFACLLPKSQNAVQREYSMEVYSIIFFIKLYISEGIRPGGFRHTIQKAYGTEYLSYFLSSSIGKD